MQCISSLPCKIHGKCLNTSFPDIIISGKVSCIVLPFNNFVSNSCFAAITKRKIELTNDAVVKAINK